MKSQKDAYFDRLLGVQSPWEVKNVELKLSDKTIEIELGWLWGKDAACPVCGRSCSLHESAPERTWRHRDTLPFTTLSKARIPRAHCPEHGVKTMSVPWAAPQGRLTLLFERFAIDVLLAGASVSQACQLLGIDRDTARSIMSRAVERGLKQRELEGLKHLGMDEKSFKRAHSCVTLLTDWDKARVLDGVKDRTLEASQKPCQTLTGEQKKSVEAVALDLWEPFIQAIGQALPPADIVHDKFHVSQYLGSAVDKVHRQEHKALSTQGDAPHKSTRSLWLHRPENHPPNKRRTLPNSKNKD